MGDRRLVTSFAGHTASGSAEPLGSFYEDAPRAARSHRERLGSTCVFSASSGVERVGHIARRVELLVWPAGLTRPRSTCSSRRRSRPASSRSAARRRGRAPSASRKWSRGQAVLALWREAETTAGHQGGTGRWRFCASCCANRSPPEVPMSTEPPRPSSESLTLHPLLLHHPAKGRRADGQAARGPGGPRGRRHGAELRPPRPQPRPSPPHLRLLALRRDAAPPHRRTQRRRHRLPGANRRRRLPPSCSPGRRCTTSWPTRARSSPSRRSSSAGRSKETRRTARPCRGG